MSDYTEPRKANAITHLVKTEFKKNPEVLKYYLSSDKKDKEANGNNKTDPNVAEKLKKLEMMQNSIKNRTEAMLNAKKAKIDNVTA